MSDPPLSAEPPRPATSGTNKRWEPPTPEELQALMPGYTIEKLLGKGGMGAVYKGVQENLERPVAIKIISNDLDEADASYGERFKNEAKAMAKLSHPGIVAVFDYGQTTNGILYIVMEYIEGTDVAKMISQQGRLHTEHAMAITAHVCDALGYAHERGIIHRDIKPANIMVGYDGVVKVADFGLAKMTKSGESGLTQSGMAMGTLHYMAPEALMLGTAVDQRADIYAVGVMLYQMLTGKIPQGLFEMPSLQVPGLDPRYDGIISKALREDREMRYSSVLDLRRDLDAILTQPVVKVEAAAAKAPAALNTQARPQRPAGPPHRSQQPEVIVPKEKSFLPILWVALIVMAVAVGFRVFKNSSKSGAASDDPAVENNLPLTGELAGVTKDAPFVNSLGMKFVPVPGTKVLMCIHETRKGDYVRYADESPGIESGWKEVKTPEGVLVGEGDDHPVVNVSWFEASSFCDWLSKKENRVYRLPSDREWSFAIGIANDEAAEAAPETLSALGSGSFAWGANWPPPPKAGNFADTSKAALFPSSLELVVSGYTDGFATTAPVMSFPSNSLGIYDLDGNVSEWCVDWYNSKQAERVRRGSAWVSSLIGELKSAKRFNNLPGFRRFGSGFRCVLDPLSLTSMDVKALGLRQSPPGMTGLVGPVKPESVTPGTDIPANAAKNLPFLNSLGMRFVPIPGAPADGKRLLVSVWETRVQDYEAFANETARDWGPPPFPQTQDHPAVGVSWDDVTAFCEWLTVKERKEGRIGAEDVYRLPLDLEWSSAAGIADYVGPGAFPVASASPAAPRFPWGESWPPAEGAGNYLGEESLQQPWKEREPIKGYQDAFTRTSPVGAFAASQLGMCDLSGNAMEWCADLSQNKTNRLLRGGSWASLAPGSLETRFRGAASQGYKYPDLGFRSVLEMKTPEVTPPAPLALAPSQAMNAPALSPANPSSGTKPAVTATAPSTKPTLPSGPTTWTDTKGRRITATFKAIASGNVLLDIAGKVTPVPLNTLSVESQKLAQDLLAAMPPVGVPLPATSVPTPAQPSGMLGNGQFSVDVALEDNQSSEITITLDRNTRTLLKTRPSMNAVVSCEGIRDGTHSIYFRADGYAAQWIKLDIADGKPKTTQYEVRLYRLRYVVMRAAFNMAGRRELTGPDVKELHQAFTHWTGPRFTSGTDWQIWQAGKGGAKKVRFGDTPWLDVHRYMKDFGFLPAAATEDYIDMIQAPETGYVGKEWQAVKGLTLYFRQNGNGGQNQGYGKLTIEDVTETPPPGVEVIMNKF